MDTRSRWVWAHANYTATYWRSHARSRVSRIIRNRIPHYEQTIPHTAARNPMSLPAKLCGAKTRTGGSCRQAAMPNGRCRLHGGKSPPPGPAHPRFKHGGRARRYALAGALEERYTRHLEDLDYMALRDELALVTAQVEALIEGGELETEAGRAEVLALVAERRKLAQAEAQRVKLARDTLTAEQARAFGAAVLEAVRVEAGQDRALVERVQRRTFTILRTTGAIQ